MTFSLRGVSIPTDGSGRILITESDINLNGDNDEDALICQSERSISGDGVGDWYLHPTEMSTDSGDRIMNPVNRVPDRGWKRNRGYDSEGRRLVRLKRASTTPEEGVFTCNIPGDDNTPRYLAIYHPSESSSDV